MKLVQLSLLCLLTGCSLSSEKFYQGMAEAGCAADQQCDTPAFDEESECITLVSVFYGALDSVCDYDAKKAKECLADTKAAGADACESDFEGSAACDEVYTNCESDDSDSDA